MIEKYKTKTGLRYRAVIRKDGKLVRGRSHRTEVEAEKDLAYLQEDEPDYRQMRLSTYWQIWNEHANGASPDWQYSQTQMFRDYIQPVIGRMRLMDIRTLDVNGVLVRMGHRSGQTRLHVYNLMRKMMADASEFFGWTVKNPVIRRIKPKADPKPRTILEPDQTVALLQAARDDYIGPAVWLGALAQLRPCEIQALKWDSIGECIEVKSAYKRKSTKADGLPKNKKTRRSVMTIALKDYLGSLPRSSEYVIAGIKTDRLSYSTFMDRLEVCCRKAGVPRITPHELRHAGSELWSELGANEEDVIRLLGHSNAASVRRYLPARMNSQRMARLQTIGNRLRVVP